MRTEALWDGQLTFWANPGHLTALDLAEDLPQDLPGVLRLLQGLMVHEAWYRLHRRPVPVCRSGEVQLRGAAAMVDRIRQLDPRPLALTRPTERRLVINCRHFAVMACALLRRAGRPVRARCGHATYLGDPGFADHWIIEVWDGRWVRVDPDLSTRERECDFNLDDIPPGKFLAGGEAWRALRAGAEPERFGVGPWLGAWMVRNNLVRDLAALHKVELLPWDTWGLMDRESRLGEGPSDELIDELAADDDWARLHRLYENDPRLTAPLTLL